MADLPSVEDKILVEETDFESPTSEQLLQKIGSNVNALIDEDNTQDGVIAANTARIVLLESPNIVVGASTFFGGIPTVTIIGVTSGKVRLTLQGDGGTRSIIQTTGDVTLKRGSTILAVYDTSFDGFPPSFIDVSSGLGSVTYTYSGPIMTRVSLVAEEIGR